MRGEAIKPESPALATPRGLPCGAGEVRGNDIRTITARHRGARRGGEVGGVWGSQEMQMDRETVPNSDWMNELRRLAVEEWGFTREQADNSMPVNWSRYYVEGLTPRQTLEEAFADDR